MAAFPNWPPLSYLAHSRLVYFGDVLSYGNPAFIDSASLALARLIDGSTGNTGAWEAQVQREIAGPEPLAQTDRVQ
jgi:hypothetical protein